MELLDLQICLVDVQRRDVASKTRKTFEETLSCAVLLFVLEEANNVSVCIVLCGNFIHGN